MPRTRKSVTPEAPLAPVPSAILDQFVQQGPISPEELETAVRRFKKAIIERALGGELTHHLAYPPGGTKPAAITNHRNGRSGKTVLTDDGPLALDVPRDREGTCEPRLIAKHERRVAGFDDKVLALYARGMTVREIQAFRGLAPRLGPRHSLLRLPARRAAGDRHDNALESVHARLRKIIKTRGHFPHDDAATKLIWLALRNTTTTWGGRGANYWREAMYQFAVLYEERFTARLSYTRAWTLPRPHASSTWIEKKKLRTKRRQHTSPTKFLTLPPRLTVHRDPRDPRLVDSRVIRVDPRPVNA